MILFSTGDPDSPRHLIDPFSPEPLILGETGEETPNHNLIAP